MQMSMRYLYEDYGADRPTQVWTVTGKGFDKPTGVRWRSIQQHYYETHTVPAMMQNDFGEGDWIGMLNKDWPEQDPRKK